MAASLTALATVVWSDLAEASQQPQTEYADELTVAPLVKTSKIEHPSSLVDALEPIMELSRPRSGKRKSRFGSFEGY